MPHMRFRLHTLLILLAVLPPMLAFVYLRWQRHVHYQQVVKPIAERIALFERQRQALRDALNRPAAPPPIDETEAP